MMQTLYGWSIYEQMYYLMQIQYLHHCFNVTEVHYVVKIPGKCLKTMLITCIKLATKIS